MVDSRFDTIKNSLMPLRLWHSRRNLVLKMGAKTDSSYEEKAFSEKQSLENKNLKLSYQSHSFIFKQSWKKDHRGNRASWQTRAQNFKDLYLFGKFIMISHQTFAKITADAENQLKYAKMCCSRYVRRRCRLQISKLSALQVVSFISNTFPWLARMTWKSQREFPIAAVFSLSKA